MAGIHVVATKRFARPKSRSLCIIGDPGCDGLSSYSMRVYEEALRCARPDELTLVAGDLVPAGEASYYETFRQVTDTFARGEVLVLRGNHDTGAYTDAFGSETYAVDCDGFTLIVLDNSARLFTEASLQLLRDVLPTVKRAVVAFHIPLPNPVCGNSVPESEAAKLLETIKPYRDRVAWFVCGHVHSRFVAACGGVPMVCTGGGGAFIEDVSPSIRATDVTHHVVRLEINNAGDIACDVIDLPPSEPTERGPILESSLRNVVSEELLAHLRYLFLAERAAGRGDKASAALFRALAESEYRHARNFFTLAENRRSEREILESADEQERFEHGRSYPMMAAYAGETGAPAARLAWQAAGEAERQHARWLEDRLEGKPPAEAGYEVCPACGFARVRGSSARCPMCGAPARDFLPFVPTAD